MFARLLTVAAFVATCAQAQLTITNPSPNSWWVTGSVNTLAWTCDTSPYSAFNVILSNSDKTILSAPLALIANIPNYDCSFTVNQQQSSLSVSTTWSMQLTDILNSSNIYASTQFEIKSAGSPYPVSTSAPSGTATATTGSPSSTSGSKTGAAAANYVPVGMSMAAALMLGLLVA